MIEALRVELCGLLADRTEALSGVCAVKGSNDRVDSLTLLCREVLRASSLCFIGGLPYCYNGRFYEGVTLKDVLGVLCEGLVDAGVSPLDVRRMGDMPLGVISERRYRRTGNLIAFRNGLVSLGADSCAVPQLYSFDWVFPDDARATEALGYDYDASAGCPMWEAFLGEVLPDEGERLVLQEFLGCCYIDRRVFSIEKFGIFLGSGANGKSVIRDVISRVMGRENVAAYDAEQLTRSELLPFLIGKRIDFASDMKVSAAFESDLKALASGQDVIGRKIYGEPVVVNCPPLVFSMNALPPFRDQSPAFFRRVLLFSFDVVVPEDRRDPALAERICSCELPGIFNWLMEGRMRLIMNGGRFSPCERMDAALATLKRGLAPKGEHPARDWLVSQGYSLKPFKGGSVPSLVSAAEIRAGTGLSATAITRELRSFGVETHRGKMMYYKVYKI